MRRIYISGPMTGLPDFNFAAFEAAEKLIRKVDPSANVINPHTVEHGLGLEGAWEQYLKFDLKAMLDCDLVVILPGWHNSKGSLLEIHVATSVGIPIVCLEFFERALP